MLHRQGPLSSQQVLYHEYPAWRSSLLVKISLLVNETAKMLEGRPAKRKREKGDDVCSLRFLSLPRLFLSLPDARLPFFFFFSFHILAVCSEIRSFSFDFFLLRFFASPLRLPALSFILLRCAFADKTTEKTRIETSPFLYKSTE